MLRRCNHLQQLTAEGGGLYHLRNIFRKVGLRARVELARLAHLWVADRPGIADHGTY